MFKEKLLKLLNDIIYPFTAIFTGLILFLGILSYGTSTVPAIPVNNMLLLALYSFILALLNRIFYIKKLVVYIRMAIHFIFTTLALYLMLFIFTKNIISATENIRIVLVLFYAVIYIAIAVVYICIRESKKFKQPKTKKQTAEEYQSIYGDKK